MSRRTSPETNRSEVTITRISGPVASASSWALAVFAHNEGPRIRAALESIALAAGGHDVEVTVLANGCSDGTADEVRACATVLPNLRLAEIAVADKANAWNVYVHEIVTPERAAAIETYFFMDGDVTLEADALLLLDRTLQAVPSAQAAGGMPASGRDKAAWRGRMVENGILAGNLYALRPGFVAAVRERQIRLPMGMVFEDSLVSWLVATRFGQPADLDEDPQLVFCSTAEFSFRSLSLMRPRDYRLYLRRKWRYACGGLQLEMLVNVLRARGPAAMPRHVNELYRTAPLPSRLRWVGTDTPLRLAAVLWVRSFRTTP